MNATIIMPHMHDDMWYKIVNDYYVMRASGLDPRPLPLQVLVPRATSADLAQVKGRSVVDSLWWLVMKYFGLELPLHLHVGVGVVLSQNILVFLNRSCDCLFCPSRVRP